MHLSERTLYLHIGLPKTGTTFLQRHVFPGIESLFVLCKPLSEIVTPPSPWQSGLSTFFDCSPVIWSSLGERLFSELLEGRSPEDGRSVLISDENLSPSMRYPRDFLGPPKASFGCGPVQTARHLTEMAKLARARGLARTRIIVILRRQDTWLASAYAQSSDRWPNASQAHFERWVGSVLDPAEDYWTTGVTLDFALLRRVIVDVVGSENVFMLPFELMQEDLAEFLGRWFAFMGIPEHAVDSMYDHGTDGNRALSNIRSVGPDTWKIRPKTEWRARSLPLRPWRLWNSLHLPTRILLRLPEFRRGKTVSLTPAIRAKIMETYSKSNGEVSEYVGVDLGKYGYF
jgi:hypothetical protein